MYDVNLDRSLIVKGCRVDGRLHDISYQSFRIEHSRAMGQGSCQRVGKTFPGRGWGGVDLDSEYRCIPLTNYAVKYEKCFLEVLWMSL